MDFVVGSFPRLKTVKYYFRYFDALVYLLLKGPWIPLLISVYIFAELSFQSQCRLFERSWSENLVPTASVWSFLGLPLVRYYDYDVWDYFVFIRYKLRSVPLTTLSSSPETSIVRFFFSGERLDVIFEKRSWNWNI